MILSQDKSSELIDPFIEKFDLLPYAAGDLTGLNFAVKDLIDIENRITPCLEERTSSSHS